MLCRIIHTFVGLVFSASLASADMMDNDPKYRMSLSKAIDVVEHLGNCCPNAIWEGLDPESDLSKYNYEFPLTDGNRLYLILDSIGAHTFWYRAIKQTRDGISLVQLAQPTWSEGGWNGVGVVSELFNPTFDVDNETLVVWDFQYAGDYLIKFVYEYQVEFILTEMHEDNLLDGKSEYNHTIHY